MFCVPSRIAVQCFRAQTFGREKLEGMGYLESKVREQGYEFQNGATRCGTHFKDGGSELQDRFWGSGCMIEAQMFTFRNGVERLGPPWGKQGRGLKN